MVFLLFNAPFDIRPNIPVIQYPSLPSTCNEMLITSLWSETIAEHCNQIRSLLDNQILLD